MLETYVHADLFPQDYCTHSLADYVQEGLNVLCELGVNLECSRIPGTSQAHNYSRLVRQYGVFPEDAKQPRQLVRTIISDFMPGAVHWRSNRLMYNIGSSVNIVSAALQAVALDLNVNLVNDDIAGSVIAAEHAVMSILCSVAGIDPQNAYGLFTFGGTGTILYAVKIGSRKAYPASAQTGIPTGTCVFTTEDAHFSHTVVADWLGLGTHNVIEMKARNDRRTDVAAAEAEMRKVIEGGNKIAAILVNGGTTYDHAIDDIPALVQLRDTLVAEYHMSYVPHIHVDSVIGWAWLNYLSYDFDTNPLNIGLHVLDKLRLQGERIQYVRLADSWGVDFHKGVGSCPVDCSMLIVNDRNHFLPLSKKAAAGGLHQIPDELSLVSPVEHTLETSRAGGKALAALGALHALGRRGYQVLLANLVAGTTLFREILGQEVGVQVVNQYDLGFVTMVRLYPPELQHMAMREQELSSSSAAVATFIDQVNMYNQHFFRWDNCQRMASNDGVVYSFSKKYVTAPSKRDIAALKFYSVSPHLRLEDIHDAVRTLLDQKRYFDAYVWDAVNQNVRYP